MRRLLLCAAVCLVAGPPAPAAEPVLTYGDNPSAGRYEKINGIKLYYELYGSGSPPVVVLHGNGGSISALRYQIAYFSARRQVIAVDSRGHGRSEMGSGRLTYEQMADDVSGLLKRLKAKPADVIGWSDGGIVALLMARRHPDKVRRIAISGANLNPEALGPETMIQMKNDMKIRCRLTREDASKAKECQYAQLTATQPHITGGDLSAITIPVMVMAGEHDLIPRDHTRAIAAGLPHSKLHIFTGAGHGALQEKPAEFNAVVAGFLEL